MSATRAPRPGTAPTPVRTRGRKALLESPRARGASRRTLLIDTGIAVVLAGLLLANGYLYAQLVDGPEALTPTAVTHVSGLVLCLALAVRRRWPLTVLIVTAIAFTIYGFNQGADPTAPSVALFIAVMTAGSDGAPGVRRDWVRGVVIAALFGTIFYAFSTAPQAGATPLVTWFGQVYTVALNIFYFIAAWVLGDQIRLRRRREADLEHRTEQLSTRTLELEVERERSAEKAANDERLRIARELHDVLGHHVSVMGVQAGAARRILDRDPDGAREALTAIEGSSRQATTELQRVLRLLRDPTEGTGPLGALARVEELVGEVRRAGVAVTVQADDLPELPVEIDLAAVRIIQESLTNVLRHAGPGSSAWVKAWADDGLHVEVGDDGQGRPPIVPADRDGDRDGTGVQGMRERAELHGGTFEAGPVPPRGWMVHAVIPCSGASAPAIEDAPAPAIEDGPAPGDVTAETR